MFISLLFVYFSPHKTTVFLQFSPSSCFYLISNYHYSPFRWFYVKLHRIHSFIQLGSNTVYQDIESNAITWIFLHISSFYPEEAQQTWAENDRRKQKYLIDFHILTPPFGECIYTTDLFRCSFKKNMHKNIFFIKLEIYSKIIL